MVLGSPRFPGPASFELPAGHVAGAEAQAEVEVEAETRIGQSAEVERIVVKRSREGRAVRGSQMLDARCKKSEVPDTDRSQRPKGKRGHRPRVSRFQLAVCSIESDSMDQKRRYPSHAVEPSGGTVLPGTDEVRSQIPEGRNRSDGHG